MKRNTNTTHKHNTTKTNKIAKFNKKQQEKQRKIIINWHNYCIALGKRGNFLYFLDEAIKLGAFDDIMPTHKKGHPTKYTDALITLMLIYREIYHQPLRQVVEFTRGVLLCRGIVQILPSYTTICRRASKLEIEILPPDYHLKVGNEGICYMLDSSGFKISGEGEWFRKKWGEEESRTWMESHVGINYNDRMILSVINTDCNIHDNTQLLPSLINAEHNLAKTNITLRLDTVIGDGAYDYHENYTLAKTLGATFIAPPPKNAVLRMHKDKGLGKFVDDVGWEDRNKVVKAIQYNGGLAKWKEDVGYHRRSLNENVFFRYKTIFGDRMMNKTKENCETEQLIRTKILNTFTSFGLPKYEIL